MPQFKVYSDANGTVNSTLISLPEQGIIVVDTQASLEGGREVLRQAEGQVLFVFNTHEHFDHVSGNAAIGGRIISSTPAREAMLANDMNEGLPNCHFNEQLHLHVGGEIIRMQRFGGHCPGAAIMYLPQRRLLLTGDLIFNGRVPWMGQADYPTWIAALNELSTWEVDTVIPGHGPLGGKELLTQQRELLESFVTDVQSWQAGGTNEETMLELAATKYNVKPDWYNMLRLAFKRVPQQS